MKKVLIILFVILSLTMSLLGCEKEPQPEYPISTTSPEEGEKTIKEVHVTEESLSEINIDEETLYANASRNWDQFFSSGEKSNSVCHNVILADYQSYFIASSQDGKEEKLFDDRIYYFYCDQEGIYYAIDKSIYFLSYFEGEPELILEIPEDISFNVMVESKFVVNKGSLWVGTYNTSQNEWPLLEYDLNTKTLTKFDKGGLDAVNNGFLYFVDYYYSDGKLYRFDCEKHTVQLVSDIEILHFDFCNNYILYNDFEALYRMDSIGSKKILSADQIKPETDILGVRCENNRIFVQYAYDYTDDPDAFEEIEIDIDGNIVIPIE